MHSRSTLVAILHTTATRSHHEYATRALAPGSSSQVCVLLSSHSCSIRNYLSAFRRSDVPGPVPGSDVPESGIRSEMWVLGLGFKLLLLVKI